MDRLEELMEQNRKFCNQRSQGVNVRYILLAKSGSKALKRSEADLYIPELKIGDFYIQKDKVVFGKKMTVVPLCFITIYREVDADGNSVGLWNEKQARALPLKAGSYYDRVTDSGTTLSPVHWVIVRPLNKNIAVDDVPYVISFKSTGSKIWKKWRGDCENRGGSSAILAYNIFESEYSNSNYTWTDVGYEFAGNIAEKSRDLAIECLEKSNALYDSYNTAVLIQDRDMLGNAGEERKSIESPERDISSEFDDIDLF